jgi:glutathione S-transferase
MVQLVDGDIKTREVLDWKGVHVLHFMGSSCSQKLRIFLNLKGIKWESHLVDLFANENFLPWFLGINPRGLVPVLVHDGAVHIESNDIIQYLEQKFPTPKLIPAGHENEIAGLLKHEDDLHLDLRTLSFRFVFNPPGPPKPVAMLESYAANGTGTVRGAKDRDKEIQIEFWQRAAKGRLHRRAGTRLGAQVPRRVRRTRAAAGTASLPDGRQFERARHRLVDLRPPAVAGRLPVRAAASASRHVDGKASRQA